MMAAVFRLALLFSLAAFAVAQNQIRITSPAPQAGSQTQRDINNCQPLAARKATFTNPNNVFYTGKTSAFRYTVNTVLNGPIDLSVVKFPGVTNRTITPPTPDKPNPITFPRNDSLNAATTGVRNFELIFTEEMKCHPCMLQISVAATGGTYYHCTDIGVFSRLDDWIVQLTVQKAPAEAVLLPNTFLNKLIQSYPGQGFSVNTVEIPDTAFPVDSGNSQYTITFYLIDNPDRTSTEMAANFQGGAQDAGTRLQLNVVGLSLTRPSQPGDSGTDNTGVVIAIVVILLAVAIGGGAFAWYRHRTTNGQPICCCAPKSVAGRRV